MEKKFTFKNLKISPKKLRFLLPAVKKLSPVKSLDYLLYSPKNGAKILKNAIKSAIDALKSSLKIDENQLKFKALAVNEGRRLKRYQSGGRGTVKPIVHRYSHLTIVLTDNKSDNVDKIDTQKVESKKAKEITNDIKDKKDHKIIKKTNLKIKKKD